MEGWNPSTGCTMRCTSIGAGCRMRGWVPPPRSIFPRRDPLVDAVGRMDNPCDRPARCPPCCKPVPKFRLPLELPACNLDCYREEQAQAKYEDCMRKQMEQYACCEPQDCDPCFRPEVTVLDPNYPVIYQQEVPLPPSQVYHLRERYCRPSFFAPTDNKSREQLQRETCDRLSGCPVLKPYPCHGVIPCPPKRWVNLEDEIRSCYAPGCSIYERPECAPLQPQQAELVSQFKTRQLGGCGPMPLFKGCTTGRCGCD